MHPPLRQLFPPFPTRPKLPLVVPLKHKRYPWEARSAHELTVCIAARTISSGSKAIVFCMDMMGSTDWNSAETLFKWHPLPNRFFALLAGPAGTARELAQHCANCLRFDDPSKANVPGLLQMLRDGVGVYKHDFADSHIRSRLGISYDEFLQNGKAYFPDDLYREVLYEVRTHYSQAELIVLGFLSENPRLFKISSDSVITCDDFAVIGSGTAIGESALFFRGQSSLTDLETTIYSVFEAKWLAENAPGVGRKTLMFILREDGPLEHLTDIGYKALGALLGEMAPKQIVKSEPFPAGSFAISPL